MGSRCIGRLSPTPTASTSSASPRGRGIPPSWSSTTATARRAGRATFRRVRTYSTCPQAPPGRSRSERLREAVGFRRPGKEAAMGFLVSLIIIALGFLPARAVDPPHPGSGTVNTVGWILVLVGLVGFLADLLLWSSWGPGYLRRRTHVAQ